MKKLIIESSMQQFLPHLQVVFIDNLGIVFSRTANVGYIENGNLFVKPEYLPGGIKNSVYFDQDFTLLRESLKLKEITTESDFRERDEKAAKVTNLLLKIKNTENLEEAEKDALLAASIGENSKDVRVINALNEIAETIKTKQLSEAAKEEIEEEEGEENTNEEKPEKKRKKRTTKQPKAAKKKSKRKNK